MEINENKLKEILKEQSAEFKEHVAVQMAEQREEFRQDMRVQMAAQREEFQHFVGIVKEDFDSKIELIGEQYDSIKDMIGSFAEDLHIVKSDVEIIKGVLR